ncbi:hypothetical protein B4Q04_02115 [Zobellia sp. OII3]|nr:hypothetical protein B4Q04_02115 [Zobellia sp. OII3]
MKEDKNKLGLFEWIFVLVLFSLFLFLVNNPSPISYRHRNLKIMELVFELLFSDKVSIYILKGVCTFFIALSVFNIAKILVKKK